ncbi:hypothetical protein ACHHYP_12736 [Achlya hypogyna]|uniref:MIT domain-containing protein n=1 Tax=Achlya hypogyna TaxID=1202772 RepID=A0A1V9ZGE8_ACHHY|nr:hypothetical protein ACHHYP_12736 [Achlya hypogyna]
MSLEDRLASLRAGKTPPALTRPLLQPLGDVNFTEVSEDEWDDEPFPSFMAAPPSQPTTTPPSSEPRTTPFAALSTPPTSQANVAPAQPAPRPAVARSVPPKPVDHGLLYEKAIKIATSAMNNERQRKFPDAIDQYAEAGGIFIEIGRRELNATVQKTMKKKAYSLLTRAEALAKWYDKVQHDDKGRLDDALTQAETETSQEVAKNEAQVEAIQLELRQLKYAAEIRDAADGPALETVTAAPQIEGMKLALVNEMHSLLNLPEVDHLRTFKPLSVDAKKDEYAVELSQKVESLQKELAFEKATHLLSNFVRKKRFQSQASADDDEQRRLQQEVDRLRHELQVHQATLEATRQSIVQITQEKLMQEEHVETLTTELQRANSHKSMGFFGRKKSPVNPPGFFLGPRGLKKKNQESATAERRRSDPSLASPRGVRRQQSASDGEEDKAADSVWL